MKSLLDVLAKRWVPAIGPSSAIPRQVAVSVNDCPGWSVSLVVGCDAAPGSDSQTVAGPLVPFATQLTMKSAGARRT